MKTIVLNLCVLTATFGSCQATSNIISFEAYEKIQINDAKLSDIRKTYGKESLIEKLFGKPISKEIDVDGNHFIFDGFDVGFSAIISDGTQKHPILGSFEILNKKASITIKGVTFTVGDNISVLGNSIKFNTKKDGSKSILFQYCLGCNNFILIRFNQVSKIITEIKYVELT